MSSAARDAGRYLGFSQMAWFSIHYVCLWPIKTSSLVRASGERRVD